MKLSSRFNYSKIRFDQNNNLKLLLSAVAPKLSIDSRKPINLIVALDISSSMAGAKIDFVKRSALKLIDQLGSEDKLGIITFDHNVYNVFEPTFMRADLKDQFRQKINAIQSNGSTNFSGAMLEALRQAKAMNTQVRVVVLTDGQPSTGVTNRKQIVELAKANLNDDVSLSTFGYGPDHESEFLTELAEAGRGNFAYVKNPDDALMAFGKELGGLLSCYAQKLKFVLTPMSGVVVKKVVSDVDVEQHGNVVHVLIPDLYSEETRHLVLDIQLEQQKKKTPRAFKLFDIALEYFDVQANEVKTITEKAKLDLVDQGQEDKVPNKDVMEQATLAEIMEAQKQALVFASAGNYAAASACFNSVDLSNANAHGLAYADLASATVSSAKGMSTNSHVIRASGASFRSGRQTMGSAINDCFLSNEIQDSMVKNFVDPATTAVQPPTVTVTTTTNLAGMVGTAQAGGGNFTNSLLQATKPEETTTLSKKRKDQW